MPDRKSIWQNEPTAATSGPTVGPADTNNPPKTIVTPATPSDDLGSVHT